MRRWIEPVVEGAARAGMWIWRQVQARRRGRKGPTATEILEEHERQAPEAVEDTREYLEEVRRGDTP